MSSDISCEVGERSMDIRSHFALLHLSDSERPQKSKTQYTENTV